MRWNLRSNRPANEEASAGTGSKLRKRAAVAAGIVAVSTAAGTIPALGIITPDRAQPYAGSYVLWYGTEFAGHVRNLSGCARYMEAAWSASNGADVQGKAGVTPCTFDVGLDISTTFRKALTDALSGTPAVADVAVGLLDGTGQASASELRFRGYVSDVTLPGLRTASTSDPRFIRVELMSATGTTTTVAPGRPVPRYRVGVDPVEAAKPVIRLEEGWVSFAGAGPLEFKREDHSVALANPILVAPGGLHHPQPELRVQDSASTAEVTKWFDEHVPGEEAPRQRLLRIRYISVSGSHALELTKSVFPHHFDPFPRTDGERVLGVAGKPVSVAWASPR